MKTKTQTQNQRKCLHQSVRGKPIEISAYLKKKWKISNNLTLHQDTKKEKKKKKKEQTKSTEERK